MGWTSSNYTETIQKNLNAIKAYEFCKIEYNNSGYEILKFYFQKAKILRDNHVVYLVMKHPNNYNFIMVVLISIEKNEIYSKEITASMGPTEDGCLVEFLSLVKLPNPNEFEYNWFIKVMKRNIKYKNQLI